MNIDHQSILTFVKNLNIKNSTTFGFDILDVFKSTGNANKPKYGKLFFIDLSSSASSKYVLLLAKYLPCVSSTRAQGNSVYIISMFATTRSFLPSQVFVSPYHIRVSYKFVQIYINIHKDRMLVSFFIFKCVEFLV